MLKTIHLLAFLFAFSLTGLEGLGQKASADEIFEIKFKEFLEEFNTDTQAAVKKYEGQTVKLTDKVSAIRHLKNDPDWLYLSFKLDNAEAGRQFRLRSKNGRKEWPFVDVELRLSARDEEWQKKVLAAMISNNAITAICPFKGVETQFNTSVVLEECSIK